MTGFSSYLGPEEEYVLASLATGLRTFLEVTDDSIIREYQPNESESWNESKTLLVDFAESANSLTRRFDYQNLSICDFYSVRTKVSESHNHARYTQLCVPWSLFSRSSDVSQPIRVRIGARGLGVAIDLGLQREPTWNMHPTKTQGRRSSKQKKQE
jgi:hypothetical protein